MNFVSEVLTAIDEAENVTLESMYDVFDSLLNEYDKMINADTCYVEGFVMEADEPTAGKKSAKDNKAPEMETKSQAVKTTNKTAGKSQESTAYKLIMFLPRLIASLLKKIASIFNNDNKASISEMPGKLQTTISNSSEDELKTVGDELKKKTDGIVTVEPKRKCFIVRGFHHLKNIIMLAATLPDLLRLIKGAMKKKTFTWANLWKDTKFFYRNKGELAEILINGKDPEDLKNFAAEEVKTVEFTDVLGIIGKSGYALSAAADELSMIYDKKAVDQFKAGMDPSEAMAASDMCKFVRKMTFLTGIGTSLFNGIHNLVSMPGKIGSIFSGIKKKHDDKKENKADEWDMFINSSEGKRYASYSSLADLKKDDYDAKPTGGYSSKHPSGLITKDDKARAKQEFEDTYKRWKKNNYDDSTDDYAPTSANVEAGEKKAAEAEKYKLLTDDTEPADWSVSNGKYYAKSADGKFLPLTSTGGSVIPTYHKNKFYKKKKKK